MRAILPMGGIGAKTGAKTNSELKEKELSYYQHSKIENLKKKTSKLDKNDQVMPI